MELSDIEFNCNLHGIELLGWIEDAILSQVKLQTKGFIRVDFVMHDTWPVHYYFILSSLFCQYQFQFIGVRSISQKISSHGRDQEKDAGDEAGEGQCSGQSRCYGANSPRSQCTSWQGTCLDFLMSCICRNREVLIPPPGEKGRRDINSQRFDPWGIHFSRSTWWISNILLVIERGTQCPNILIFVFLSNQTCRFW